MNEQQFLFGNCSCSLSLKGSARLTDDGDLSISYVIGDTPYCKKANLPDEIEEVSRLVVREEPLCLLVCYETKIIEIDGSNLLSKLFLMSQQEDTIDLPFPRSVRVIRRMHTVQLHFSMSGCCFSPYQSDVYLVMDSSYSFFCYSTQYHTEVPLLQLSLKEYLSRQLNSSLASARPCDCVPLHADAGEDVGIGIYLSSGLWAVVEGLPLQCPSRAQCPPLRPQLDCSKLRLFLSGNTQGGVNTTPLFIRQFGFFSCFTRRLCGCGEHAVYVAASAQMVAISLYSPSRRSFSTLAVHDLSPLRLEKPSFCFDVLRMELAVAQGQRSRTIALGDVLRAVRGKSVWGENSALPVPSQGQRGVRCVPEALMRATESQEKAVYCQEVARREVQCLDRMFGEMDDALGLKVMGDWREMEKVLTSLAPSCVSRKQPVKND